MIFLMIRRRRIIIQPSKAIDPSTSFKRIESCNRRRVKVIILQHWKGAKLIQVMTKGYNCKSHPEKTPQTLEYLTASQEFQAKKNRKRIAQKICYPAMSRARLHISTQTMNPMRNISAAQENSISLDYMRNKQLDNDINFSIIVVQL